MKAIFIDIDNTLLDFDAYVRTTMEQGFAHFGLPAYRPEMYHTFTAENNKLWRQIEEGTLTFAELQKIRWNNVFAALGIHFDGPAFEHYFRPPCTRAPSQSPVPWSSCKAFPAAHSCVSPATAPTNSSSTGWRSAV